MRRLALILLAALVGGFFVTPCLAQAVVVYDPVVAAPAPTYVYSAPVNVYSPAPVVTYRPIVPVYRYRRFAPFYAYRPAYSVPYPTTVYYPPVYVRPRFFVPGQPVRNYYRAVLP